VRVLNNTLFNEMTQKAVIILAMASIFCHQKFDSPPRGVVRSRGDLAYSGKLNTTRALKLRLSNGGFCCFICFRRICLAPALVLFARH
jgi:hypothetical protein